MRKCILSSVILILASITSQAQDIPAGMKYQAVARNISGDVIANRVITLKIELRSNPSKSTKTYYIEEHVVITSNLGLFDLVVGAGNKLDGNFNEIPWSTENIWLAVSMKDNTGFTAVSESRLLAVPYAFHAGTASKIAGGIVTETNSPGVPAAVWSLKGNSNSSPLVDKLGTTDFTHLIMVTNNLERLRITAEGNVKITNDLEVGNDLYVKKNVYLNTVSGATINNGPFTVANGSLTHLTGNALVNGRAGIGAIDNDVKFNLVSTGGNYPFAFNVSGSANKFTMNADGQLYLRSTKEGLSGSTANYAMMIDGEKQGIVIKLNEKIIPDERNHFVSFRGSTGNEVGRIEGQTLDQLHSSFDYHWTATMAFLDMAFVIAEGVATLSQSDVAETAVMALEGVQAAAQWIEYLINADANVGVSYASGSGDYAEWLEKADVSEKFSFGDIVSVSGGKISKNTRSASQLMVVSMSPIVLGNTPPRVLEKNYEKVAFMGQVPVKVNGPVNIGDYIIASGKHDGTGIAVHPSKMTIGDYKKIAGVAWSSSPLVNGVSIITLAIGINNNDLADQIEKQQQQITLLKEEMNSIIGYLNSKDPSFKMDIKTDEPVIIRKPPVLPVDIKSTSQLEYINRMIKEKPEILDKGLVMVKQKFEERGLDLSKYPELHRLFTDKEYFYKELRKLVQ